MPDDERYWIVRDILVDYVKSPSLRHIRDVYSLNKLAREIVRRMARGNSVWKSGALREDLLNSAVGCWIPVEDLRKFLNSMPGAQLTTTDVEQRRKGFEEQLVAYPDDDLKTGCLALYEKEKAEAQRCPRLSDFSGSTWTVKMSAFVPSTKSGFNDGAKRSERRGSSGAWRGLRLDAIAEVAALVLPGKR